MTNARVCLSIAVVASACSVAACGVDVSETEPNNTMQEAQLLPPLDWVTIYDVSGTIGSGDVDFFQFEVTNTSLFLVGSLEYVAVDPLDPGPYLGLFDFGGTLIETGVADVGIVLSAIVLQPGTFTLGLTGLDDRGFVGDHTHQFTYTFYLQAVPLPAAGAMPLLGVAGLAGMSRRRRAN